MKDNPTTIESFDNLKVMIQQLVTVCKKQFFDVILDYMVGKIEKFGELRGYIAGRIKKK